MVSMLLPDTVKFRIRIAWAKLLRFTILDLSGSELKHLNDNNLKHFTRNNSNFPANKNSLN